MAMARRVLYDRRFDSAAVRQRGRRHWGVPDEHRWEDAREWHDGRRRPPTPVEERWADAALDLWPAACAATPPAPVRLLMELGEAVADAQAACGVDRAAVLDGKVMPPFVQAHPDGPAALVLRGRQYIRFAWEARGYGDADDVSPDMRAYFQARLDKAADFLQRAYDLDPSDPDAATAMVHVELGRGRGRAEMEKWFARAVAADPDRRHAVPGRVRRLRLEAGIRPAAVARQADRPVRLRPRVPGHPELARCYAGAAGRPPPSGQPVRRRATYSPRSDVWADVEAVLLPPVRMNPWSNFARTRYAYYAYKCDRDEVADEQLRLLGDRADPTAIEPGGAGEGMLTMIRTSVAGKSRGRRP